MSRDYHLWLATDGEVRLAIDSPEPTTRGGRRGRSWLPSRRRFTEEEGQVWLTRHTNLSRFNNRTHYLDHPGGLGGPWKSELKAELLERFDLLSEVA
ncbi:MAG: hypothetical protein KGI98_14930 [Euryarchaeota archaeon]|nr:hypothetical protein [Euryarchaeota archaeon]MDE1879462.1 hypothetical protein [Euryarchaeota archaeon]